tara:strand:+ start:1478 stop:2029 length:552 start_codon:yes stop_codon:yes gene_type:complete
MLYTSEVIDRRTGELVRVCQGDWVTVTELGKAFDLGPRQVRQVLHHLGLVFPTAGGRGRYCLTPEAIKAGRGRCIPKSKGGRPFDVISPSGQKAFADCLPVALVAMRNRETPDVVRARAALAAFKERRLDADRWSIRMEVSWLHTFAPHLSQDDISEVLSVSKQLVSHHLQPISVAPNYPNPD